MVQIGAQGDEEKPRFAKLKAGQSIETITLEEAQELFKLPLSLGEHDNLEVSVNLGRFGPYVKFGEQFVSIPKGEDLWAVTLERAIEIIGAKQKEDAPIGFFDEKPITKGKGRFGPFIKWNDLFITIRLDQKRQRHSAKSPAGEGKTQNSSNRVRHYTRTRISRSRGMRILLWYSQRLPNTSS